MSGSAAACIAWTFHCESASISGLAMQAFGLKQSFQIEFPAWMLTARFNVTATIPEGAASTDLPMMIQHLLEDRFGLVFHRETRRMAGLELVVAKSVPKSNHRRHGPLGSPRRSAAPMR